MEMVRSGFGGVPGAGTYVERLVFIISMYLNAVINETIELNEEAEETRGLSFDRRCLFVNLQRPRWNI